MGRILDLVRGKDGYIRGDKLRTMSKLVKSTIINKTIQKLIPFEIVNREKPQSVEPEVDDNGIYDNKESSDNVHIEGKGSCRRAAVEGEYLRRLKQKYQ